jgi:uncharacterized protein YutE (UPF0331/DUF86 family)
MDSRERMMQSSTNVSKKDQKIIGQTLAQKQKPATLKDAIMIMDDEKLTESQKKYKALNKLREYLTTEYVFEF